ncbi:hypothetical protein [Natrinema sp. DC36]|uniref:hypothetical protein n=1 Tax=Natrinema sp. DC36 TaxID=2878680 RepID=UPI001CF0BC6E|nr:hypothetical protein [Natrinema sp. DC36]
MLRKLLIVFGLFEIAKPKPVIDMCEWIGLENSDEAQLRPWALWGARLEGMAFVWLLVHGRGEGSSTIVSGLLGFAGILLALVPRPIIQLSQEFVYENTEDLEMKPWIKPAARLLGGLYLTVVVLSWRADASEAEPKADQETYSRS